MQSETFQKDPEHKPTEKQKHQCFPVTWEISWLGLFTWG